jgi:hypothetical protein
MLCRDANIAAPGIAAENRFHNLVDLGGSGFQPQSLMVS